MVQRKPPFVGNRLPTQPHPLTVGMIGCWACLEGHSERLYDLTDYGHHADRRLSDGTALPAWVWGEHGYAVKFDSSNDGKVADTGRPLNLQPDEAFTLAVWTRVDSTSGGLRQIFGGVAVDTSIPDPSSDSGFGLFVTASNNYTATVATSADTTHDFTRVAHAVTAHTWQHVVVTYEANTGLKLYVDGALRDSDGTISGTIDYSPDAPYYFARYDEMGSLPFYADVSIESAYLWNRALCASEVGQLFADSYGFLASRDPLVRMPHLLRDTHIIAAFTDISFVASGGVVCGGTAINTIIASNTAAGGVVVAGSATVGGSVTETAAGGVVVAGSATAAATYNPATAGGVVVAGDAFSQIIIVGSGGVVVAGVAIPMATYAPAGAGGVVVAGVADVQHGTFGSGGVVVAGAAEAQLVITAAGGVVVAGDGTAQATYSLDTTGGVVVAGAAIDQWYIPASGGVVVAGEADVDFSDLIVTSGGVVVAGAATVTSLVNETATGGVIVLQPTFANGYYYRFVLTIPSGTVAADITGFPWWVSIELSTTTEDFLFTDASGNTVAHEVVSFNTTTGRLHAFVKLDITAASDTIFYLYFMR